MMNLAASHGIVTHQIAARAPWQQGKTERHGAHYKDLLEKARAEAVASSEDELRRLMQEVEMVKNRLQLVTDDMERQLERRRVAQKAFVEHNETVKKAFRARSRPPQEFSAGDYVYVYRVPHQRKRRVGGPDFVDRATAKPYWVGPGTVISIEGASLWISMFGELWKTAREQCIEVIMQDCKELLEEYRKRSNRAGFKDLTQEPWPEEEEQDGERHGVKRSREAEVDEQGGNPASEGGEEAHIGGGLENEGQLMSQKKSALKKKELIGGNLWKKGPGKNQDYWQFVNEGKTLRRYHVRKRKTKFDPSKAKDLPRSLKDLGPEEVNLKLESESSKKLWREADSAEWNKIAQSGAVKVFDLVESLRLREELKRQGRLDRILPSRMLRKHKHAEQPGEAPTRKSRLCIRGDKDPDLLLLDRYSPTVTTLNVSVLLQIAANKRYPIALGDLKNAFCQSAPLNRETGEIYFEIPADGLEGVDKRQLILIVNGCYGLVDAPLHWRRSLVSTLQEFGYVQSRMDPCLFKLHQNGQLAGMVAIEVDDLLTAGNHFHEEKMMKLREIYQFGKWVELQKADNGASFNGRRLQQLPDYTIKIDMKKFVEERLNQIVLPTARKKMKESEVTEEERKQARMVCGALNWLSKEGRPDASAAASLCSSKINKMKADDILMMNEAVKEIKENSGLEIRIQPLSRMRFAVVTDASFGNSDFHSQAGQMIISHEVGLREGKKVPANLLWWRSGKLQRVVNLTLAAEAQSLSKGLGDLTWALVLFRELQEEKMSLRDWASNLRHDEILALASAQSDEQLRGCLAIVGAESLFDYLSRETIGGQDRRTAIEVQIPDHKGRLI
ncbi:Retrovirus-related Pol polyprotein from transposon RE2 (Retro element 2) (AtRE2) [Includes: Protease RE2 [Durusdinium trenchii]|uniref:Retrovirus-related Pol polyprotein from transposon RE2 (Retro element 2) (AtRE2) n=1 Tax=Durusdinium trenchii TaxID=1381693 RepID=A0ABP0ITZ6_9DINO